MLIIVESLFVVFGKLIYSVSLNCIPKRNKRVFLEVVSTVKVTGGSYRDKRVKKLAPFMYTASMDHSISNLIP